MSIIEIRNITFIGAGNMATNLALELIRRGFRISQVYSRTEDHAKELAGKVNGTYCPVLEEISNDADLYIVSVTDSSLEDIAGILRLKGKIVVHTSGTIPMSVLQDCTDTYGVIYSPQTFVKIKPVDFSHLPVCYEGSDPETAEMLKGLANKLSEHVYQVDSQKRKILHLAAVFAGNFSNFMYVAAEEILSKNDLPFELLGPIIRKTAENSGNSGLFGYQTGPAVREDMRVVTLHHEMLSEFPEFRDIYDLVSRNIISYKKKNE